MQLPQNKQERQKVLGLIAIGIAAVLYGVWAGLYSPLLNNKKDAIARIAELEDKIAKAERQIRRAPIVERELMEVLSGLAQLSSNHILYPRLGNYLLPVREWLSSKLQGIERENVQVDEIGLINLPRAGQGDGVPAMQLYAARVSVDSGFEDLRQFFSLFEEEHALLGVGNVMITARPGNPLKHQISFELHFPVWTTPDYHETLIADIVAREQP